MERIVRGQLNGEEVDVYIWYLLDVPFEIRLFVDRGELEDDKDVLVSREMLDIVLFQNVTEIGSGDVRLLDGGDYLHLWVQEDSEFWCVKLPVALMRQFLARTYMICTPNEESRTFTDVQLSDEAIEGWYKAWSR